MSKIIINGKIYNRDVSDIKDKIVSFSDTDTRENIGSGDKLSTMFSKIKKVITDLKTVAYTGSYNDLSNKPTTLKNPAALTFTGGQTGSYDGSVAKSVKIPNTAEEVGAMPTTGGEFTGDVTFDKYIAIKAWPNYGEGTAKAWYNANTKTIDFEGGAEKIDLQATSAATATKLSSSGGSATQPIYFADGAPVACTYTLGKSVPSNAVFTDTTYSTFVKSGSGAKSGLVPAPSTTAGTTKYLREDGTWQTPPNTTYSLATATANGLMAATDKEKVNYIDIFRSNDSFGGVRIGSNNNAFLGDDIGGCLAIGNDINASTSYGGSVLLGFDLNCNSYTSVTIGSGNIYSGPRSVAIGSCMSANKDSISIGYAANSTTNSVAIGYMANTVGGNAVAIGYKANASAINSIALGYNAIASNGFDSVVLGHSAATTNSSYCIALGVYSKVTNNYGIALGYKASVTGIKGLSLGYNAVTNIEGLALGSNAIGGSCAVALGSNAIGGSYAIAIGNKANAANYSLAIGYNATTSITYSLALGYNAKASGDTSLALGYNTKAPGNASIALGSTANASGNISLALGSTANASGSLSIAIGKDAKALSSNTIAIGSNTSTNGEYDIALGYNSVCSNGGYNIAIGKDAKAVGGASLAIGEGSSVSGHWAGAIGWGAVCTINQGLHLGHPDYLNSLTCRVGLTTTSDERDKTDIKPIENALDFICKVEAISYYWNARNEYVAKDEEGNEILTDEEKEIANKYGYKPYDREAHALGTKKGERRRVGVSAQATQRALVDVYGSADVANIVNDNLHDFDPNEIPEGVESHLGVTYENFIPFLIKAIQELNKEVKELRAKVDNM